MVAWGTMKVSEQLAVALADQPLEEGIFQGPPAMLKAIGDWMSQVYAGHVLYRVEQQLERSADLEKVIKKRMESLKKSMESLPGDLEKIAGANKVLSYKVWDHHGESVIGVRHIRPDGEEFLWYTTGEGNVWDSKKEPGYFPVFEIGKGKKRPAFDRDYIFVDQKSTKEVIAAIRGRLEASLENQGRMLKRAANLDPEFQGSDLVELKLLQKECQKYTSTPKTYTTVAKKKFPVDLSGWKYLERVMKKYTDMPLFSKAQLQRDLEKKGYKSIDVVLSFKRHKQSLGIWFGHKRELRVDVRTSVGATRRVERFREALGEILRTLRHEVQHMGQDVLTALLGLKREAGTPSVELDPRISNKILRWRFYQKREKEHARRSQEFYTRLADEVARFVAVAKETPVSERKKRFKSWTENVYFFKVLKRYEPDKWKKAVGEFAKGVEAQGVKLSRG